MRRDELRDLFLGDRDILAATSAHLFLYWRVSNPFTQTAMHLVLSLLGAASGQDDY